MFDDLFEEWDDGLDVEIICVSTDLINRARSRKRVPQRSKEGR
jgi:hypothetical protein